MTRKACVAKYATCKARPVRLVVPLMLALATCCTPGRSVAQNAERSGKEVVDAVCSACHATGAHGAPKIGDKRAWSKLAARGLTGLSQSALKGIRNMPAHGGNPSLTDTEVQRAITYMVNQSGGHWIEPVSTTAPPAERSGEEVVKAQCVKCHHTGVGGAPRIGDRAAWIPRLKQGVDTLVRSAINGHGGMPPRGGVANFTDGEIRNAIVYMFNPVTVATQASPGANTITGQDFAVVGGTTVYFGVVPADVIRAYPKAYPRSVYGVAPSGPAQYYVTVALFDTASGQRIDDAVVKARVSTATRAGPEKTLEPTTIDASRSYGNYFTMGGEGPYKVAVQIKRAGLRDTIQAQFEYTHQ